jgi:hypothetical protein
MIRMKMCTETQRRDIQEKERWFKCVCTDAKIENM